MIDLTLTHPEAIALLAHLEATKRLDQVNVSHIPLVESVTDKLAAELDKMATLQQILKDASE